MVDKRNLSDEDRWEYLKKCSLVDIGLMRISPPSDLSWMLYTLIDRIKRLEEITGEKGVVNAAVK